MEFRFHSGIFFGLLFFCVICRVHSLPHLSKATTETFSRSLVETTPVTDGPLFERSFMSARVSRDGKEEPVCKNQLFDLLRTMTLAGEQTGTEEEAAYIDVNFGFFKFALGWTDEEIENSRLNELEEYKKFGVDATRAKLNKTTGFYTTRNGRFGLAPVVFNIRLAKVADSEKLVPCTNVTAVVGGWILFGEDVSWGGVAAEGGKRVKIAGESSVFTLYIVFAPGSQFSTKIEARSTLPSGCQLGLCPIAAKMTIIDDFHEPLRGNLDGVIVEKPLDDKGTLNVVLKWTLTWPEQMV